MASLTKDPNWDNTDAALWSFIELCIGVLTSSLPTLRPLIAVVLPRQFGSSGRRGYQDYSGGQYGTSRSRALSVAGLGGSSMARKNGGGLPKSSAASDSLEELHQYKYGRDDKDLERAIGGGGRGDAAPGYSVNVSCEHDDTFEMQRTAAVVVAPQSPPGAKRSRPQNQSGGGGNGIVATTVVTREYEPSVRIVV